jgi:hypothetical protein
VVGVVIHLLGQAHEGWLATPRPTLARRGCKGDVDRYWPIRTLGGWSCVMGMWIVAGGNAKGSNDFTASLSGCRFQWSVYPWAVARSAP